MQDPQSIEQRVAGLERSLRRHKLALVVGTACAGCALVASSAAPRVDEKELRAQRFVLVDAQGREWGELGMSTELGVGLSLSTPDQASGAGAWAAIGLVPPSDSASSVSGWSSGVHLEAAADRASDVESGVNIAATPAFSIVSPWWGEHTGASLRGRSEGPSLLLETEAGDTDAELGALELSLSAGKPAIEGRSRDATARFRLP